MSQVQEAIDCLYAQQKAVDDFGFSWDTISQLVEHARSECDEIDEALKLGDPDKITGEIADLVRAAVTLCCVAGLDVGEIINNGNAKFQKRFDVVKALVARDGLSTLKGQPYSVILAYWKEAKKQLPQAA